MMFTRDAYELPCFQALYTVRRRWSLVHSIMCLMLRIDTVYMHVSMHESAPTKFLEHIIFAMPQKQFAMTIINPGILSKIKTGLD